MKVPIVKTSFQLIISIFSIGCNQLPNQIPEDFQLILQSTAIQPGANGNYSLIIRRKVGNNQYELIRNYDNTIHQLTLSNDGVQSLYNAVRHANVFKLKTRYADMDVLDGTNITLTVHANGKTKVVSMRNTQPDELKSVFSILREFELELR